MIKQYINKGKQIFMEQLMELLPTIIGALLIVGGGTFTLVRWLFNREEVRREIRQAKRDRIEVAQREAEENIWARANETIDRLREEVKLLRADNKVLRREICELRAANNQLREELHILTRLLEEDSI